MEYNIIHLGDFDKMGEFLQTIVFSQVIKHFENPDSKWNGVEIYPTAEQNDQTFVATTTFVYGFQGDTLFRGETWNKMYVTNVYPNPFESKIYI